MNPDNKICTNLKCYTAKKNMVGFSKWFLKNKTMNKDTFFEIQKEVLRELIYNDEKEGERLI